MNELGVRAGGAGYVVGGVGGYVDGFGMMYGESGLGGMLVVMRVEAGGVHAGCCDRMGIVEVLG